MSFINSYDEIKAQVEERISNIDELSDTDAALVAASAQLLNGRNQPIGNMPILLEYLQDKQDLVADTTTIKEIALLLGASMGSKNVVWKMQEFLANGTFTVPNNIAGGVVYITGCGGGGSGRTSARNAGNGGLSTGGAGGFYVVKSPVEVIAGEAVTVTVGAGGASIVTPPNTSGSDGNPGGDSIFKTLTIKGGGGGVNTGTSGASAICPAGGFLPGYFGYVADPAAAAIFAGSYVHGDTSGLGACGKPSYVNASGRISAETGGAAGFFGSGTNSVSVSAANATATNALPNTGAGGGAAGIIYPTATRDKTATSGAGGSGRIIVEWQEFA